MDGVISITAWVRWNLCKYSVCTCHVMQTGRVVTRASLVCLMSLLCLKICLLTQTGRMFYACTRFWHFQITVSNTFYVDNPSATLPESVNVSFSIPSCICIALKLVYFYTRVVSQSLVQATLVYLWIFLTISFAFRITHRLFVVVYSGGTTVAPHPAPLKVKSKSVVTSTCVTKSRL